MNERIKQLAEQAQVGSAEFDNDINYFVSTEETFNKFALLIVKECCAIADQVEQADMDSYASKYIKAHFGVEE